MKTTIILAIFLTGCLQVSATEPEACVTQSFSVPGLAGVPAVNGTLSQTEPINVPVGIGALQSLQLVAADSSLTLSEPLSDQIVFTLNSSGSLPSVQLADLNNGVTIFTNENLAPYLDSDNNLSGTLTVSGSVPSESSTITATLCFSASAQVQYGL